MKLREKIKLCVDNDQLEKIADDFAIGFAEWILDNILNFDKMPDDNAELLEIYKKEKGL